MKLTVHPLTPERFADLETIFEARGCSVARNCWCMYYRVSGKGAYARPSEQRKTLARNALKELAEHDPPPGLVGYRGRTPVGWLALGPREGFAKLASSPTMKPVDGQPVWSIVCFVVPSDYRQQGVAHELLAGAVGYARKRGVKLLEAYPVDAAVPGAPDASWFGFKTMFDAAGFEEVECRRAHRPIVRLALSRRK